MSSSSPSLPAELEGLPVARWLGLQEAALLVDRSDRTIQRWMDRGLPHHGRGRDLRIPLPHLVVWARYFIQEVAAYGESGRVPFGTALAAQRAEMAAWELRERQVGRWT